MIAMSTTGNLYFGNFSMGLSDKAFHIKRDAEPARVMQLLREYAQGSASFDEFIGALFVSSGGEDPGIYLGKLDDATYDYFVDYDENLVRVVLHRDVAQSASVALLKGENERYSGAGEVLYDEKSGSVVLIIELIQGAESPNAKKLSDDEGSSYTAKFEKPQG